MTIEEGESNFHVIDCIILGLMFLISLLIGLYYAFTGRKHISAKEYYNAGGNIGVLPATISLLASILCSIWYVGFPTEVYFYGFHYLIDLPVIVICLTICAVAFLPVFYELNVSSANEYLEKRFNKTVRLIGSALYIVNAALYISIVMYIPSTAISQVLRINTWISICTMCLVGTLYTALGGIRAVIWTDVFQAVIIYVSLFAIAIIGTMDVGGVEQVWEKGVHGKRISIAPLSLDPRYRYNIIGMLLQCFCFWLSFYGTHQTQIQRYLSCPSIRSAQKALLINIPGLVCVEFLLIYVGLVMYAKFSDCDPLSNGEVGKVDEILIYFVTNMLKNFSGMSGLFVAGIFSGALSTVSSGLNSMATVTMEDFILSIPYYAKITEKTKMTVCRWIAIIYGVLSIFLMLLVEKMDNIIEFWSYNNGAVLGINLGFYVLGLFCPWTNSAGVLCAFVLSAVFGLLVSFGGQMNAVTFETAPLTVSGCESHLNLTLLDQSSLNVTNVSDPQTPYLYVHDLENNGGIYELFKISPLFVLFITFFFFMAVGNFSSLLFGCSQREKVDVKLFSPVIRKFVGKRWTKIVARKVLIINSDDQIETFLNHELSFQI